MFYFYSVKLSGIRIFSMKSTISVFFSLVFVNLHTIVRMLIYNKYKFQNSKYFYLNVENIFRLKSFESE